ncbi:MAG: NAD(P)/FAD-dependent oxidoreductase [Nitratireductor sp.]
MLEADLVILGAGAAGMAAARTAADNGLSVVLLDEQRQPGGQIYRNVGKAGAERLKLLGSDYAAGKPLVDALTHPAITHLATAIAWQIDVKSGIACSIDGRASRVVGRRYLLATGAIERPMPLPGWTLPGVMTAGAAQILLKQSAIVCTDAVLVGSGPLLYLVAAQMARAGSPPLAIVETQTRRDLLAAMRHGLGALRGWRYLAKGIVLLSEVRRAGIKRHVAATDIAIDGKEMAEAVSFTAGGKQYRIECSTVLLHHGVVPNNSAARSVGILHEWNRRQRCFVSRRDEWGRTNVAELFVAGDGSAIGGANAAVISGRLAALEIARELGVISLTERDRKAVSLNASLNCELAARPFLDRAYPPFAAAVLPADGTIICRCEEVTAGEIRRFAGLGCIGPNQAKAFSRAGMGPCQGRYCGLAVTELLAHANRLTQDETGYYRIRPPLKPVTLGELAAIADDTSN